MGGAEGVAKEALGPSDDEELPPSKKRKINIDGSSFIVEHPALDVCNVYKKWSMCS